MAIKKRVEAVEAKKFGVILGVGLLLLAGYFLWREHPMRAYVVGGIGAASLLLPFVIPPLWLKIFRLWMKFAEGLSWVMTRVILSVFFFLILTPVGLFMRILGKNPLDLKFRDNKATYWIDKPKGEYTVERYKRLY